MASRHTLAANTPRPDRKVKGPSTAPPKYMASRSPITATGRRLHRTHRTNLPASVRHTAESGAVAAHRRCGAAPATPSTVTGPAAQRWLTLTVTGLVADT